MNACVRKWVGADPRHDGDSPSSDSSWLGGRAAAHMRRWRAQLQRQPVMQCWTATSGEAIMLFASTC